MSHFQYKYAKPDDRVGGSGMDVEMQMTCRGRSSILGPPQLWAQANGFPTRGYFRKPSSSLFLELFLACFGFFRENIPTPAMTCTSVQDDSKSS